MLITIALAAGRRKEGRKHTNPKKLRALEYARCDLTKPHWVSINKRLSRLQSLQTKQYFDVLEVNVVDVKPNRERPAPRHCARALNTSL